MHTDIPNHEPSLMMMNCGDVRQVRPSFGSWVTYGLGSENQNLPGFIVLCPDGLPTQGNQNWRSAFLPGAYQATHIDTRETQIEKLIENIRNDFTTSAEQRRQLDLLAELNRGYQERRQNDALLEARVQSFELAYRMQMEADDAFDLSKEPEHIQKMYGEGLQARQMMIARRLLERGVRFVQVWHGAGQPWDSHDDIRTNHGRLARECDQPIAALLKDLKQRGMLEDTLVIWGGEFGRTPTVELPDLGANSGMVNGRDHNPYGFTHVAGGRRAEERPRLRRDRRVRLRGGREQGPRARSARDAASPPRLRSREIYLPLRRPRFPPDRRARPGGARPARVMAVRTAVALSACSHFRPESSDDCSECRPDNLPPFRDHRRSAGPMGHPIHLVALIPLSRLCGCDQVARIHGVTRRSEVRVRARISLARAFITAASDLRLVFCSSKHSVRSR